MSILIITYLCGVFPLLLGTMGNHFLKQAELPAYVLGHAMQFAVLAFCGLLIKYSEISILSFAKVYVCCAIVVGIFCVIMTCREWKNLVTWHPSMPKVFTLAGEFALMAMSILICVPHWMDMTEETLYQLSVSGELSDMHCLLYGTLQQLTGLNPVTLVRLWLPIFLLPLFYSAYHYFAQERVWFLVFAFIVYAGFIAFPGYVGMQVFLNVWNPVTLSVVIWIPILLWLLVQALWKEQRNKSLVVEIVIVFVALQGLLAQAWIYALVFVVSAFLARLGYALSDKRGGQSS